LDSISPSVFFQVHGVDEHHQVVVQKALQRSELLAWFGQLEPCLVGMEACATAHYWAREIGKLLHRKPGRVAQGCAVL